MTIALPFHDYHGALAAKIVEQPQAIGGELAPRPRHDTWSAFKGNAKAYRDDRLTMLVGVGDVDSGPPSAVNGAQAQLSEERDWQPLGFGILL
jgi:hypothetical protein